MYMFDVDEEVIVGGGEQSTSEGEWDKQGSCVVFLDSVGEEDEGEVVILKLEDTDDDSEGESYVGVEDEEILNKVFAIFKEKYKDEFNFVDED